MSPSEGEEVEKNCDMDIKGEYTAYLIHYRVIQKPHSQIKKTIIFFQIMYDKFEQTNTKTYPPSLDHLLEFIEFI